MCVGREWPHRAVLRHGKMITCDPDVSRLVDRMKKRGLSSRARESRDRRMLAVLITPGGLELVDRLDEPAKRIDPNLLGHLGKEPLHALGELLAAARAMLE